MDTLMTRHKYEVKLLPPEEGLSSLFETRAPSTNAKEAAKETRREVTSRGQLRRSRTSAEEDGTLTVITHERTIRRAYFNNKVAPVTFDTCSHVSMVEFKNPKHTRIMKIGKRMRMNHLCMENDTGKESDGGAAVRGEPS